MRSKMIALALGFLLLTVPGAFAQYGGGSGTQTFTVPRLTVNPGPFSLTGTFSLSGDLEMGSGAQIFLDDGSAADPALGFLSDQDTGIFHEADHELNFTSNGTEISEWKYTGALTWFAFLAPGVGESMVDFIESGTDYDIDIRDFDSGGSAFSFTSSASDATAQLGSGDENTRIWIGGLQAGSHIRYDPGYGGANYTEFIWPAQSGAQQLTVPALTGTLLAGGANNQLGAVTTTINSETQFNIHSNANVTIDGDADNGGGGSVILSADNDAHQVLVGDAAVTMSSDAQIGGTVDDATDSTSLLFTPTAVTLDADVDDGNDAGTLTLTADNSAATVVLSDTAVDIDHDAQISGTVDDATDSTSLLFTPTAVTLDADVDDGNDAGTLTLTADNSAATVVLSDTAVDIDHDTDVTIDADTGTDNASLTLDGDGNAATLSVSDGTDTADIRMDQTSLTLDGDVDDGNDGGAVTLTTNNSINQVALGSSVLSSPMTFKVDVSTVRYGQDDLAWADNVAETLFTFNIPDTSLLQGRFRYFSRFNSGGGTLVSNMNEVIFACVNEADAEVCDVNAVTTEASAVDGDSGVTMACTAGYAAGTNAVSIQLTCDTSDGSGGTVDWVLESESITSITAVGS